MATNNCGNIEVHFETRLCKVNDMFGYFQTWEYYSKPLPESPLRGGAPAGVFSKVFGIVEFPDGVKRVDPTDIQFCDETHESICMWNKVTEEKNE